MVISPVSTAIEPALPCADRLVRMPLDALFQRPGVFGPPGPFGAEEFGARDEPLPPLPPVPVPPPAPGAALGACQYPEEPLAEPAFAWPEPEIPDTVPDA